MSSSRIPFQSVNESKIEAIVGIQISETCRIVGIPTIARTIHRSRPSNWRRRRTFGPNWAELSAWVGGIRTWAAVATATPASLREENAPASRHRRARSALSAEDHLGLGLHVF